MKLFTAIGTILTATTTVIENTAKVAITGTDTLNNAMERTSTLIDRGFDAIELPTNNMLADMKCDNIVEDAQRESRIDIAQAQAAKIRASLTTAKKTRTSKAK